MTQSWARSRQVCGAGIRGWPSPGCAWNAPVSVWGVPAHLPALPGQHPRQTGIPLTPGYCVDSPEPARAAALFG